MRMPGTCRSAIGAVVLVLVATAAPAQERVALEGVVRLLTEVADPERGVTVPFAVYVPDRAGAFPVVVHSHGGLATATSGEWLHGRWAVAGFVVIAPTHRDSRDRDGRAALNRPFSLYLDRAKDMALGLAHAAELAAAARADVVADTSITFAAGHSFGNYTAQVVMGVRPRREEMLEYFRLLPSRGLEIELPPDELRPLEEWPSEFVDLRVPGFDAGLFLSGPGVGLQGLVPESYATLTAPAIAYSGTADTPQPWGAQELANKLDPFWRSPAGGKHAVFITGADHITFAGALADRQPEATNQVLVSSLAFLRAYGHGDAEALAILTDDDLGGADAGDGEHPDLTDVAYNLDGSEPCTVVVRGDCSPAGRTDRDGLRAFDR